MDTLSYKTISANKETNEKEWFVVDAENQTLGRLASKVAKIVRGKHKPSFTPHADCGDCVVIINADKVNLTGDKWNAKQYIRYTGYPGGQRVATATELKAKHPGALVEKAIRGMLPKNKLGRAIFKANVYVYAGNEHKHEAQKPKNLDLNTIK